MKINIYGSGGIRTHASEETGALNQRLRPLGHATLVWFSVLQTKWLLGFLMINLFPFMWVIVYGHTMLNTPVLVWSLQLSNIGLS